MTNQQILKKAIEKAVKNGFEMDNFYPLWYKEKGKQAIPLEGLIFFHPFAKAGGYRLKDLGAWCDEGKEPLKYLAKFL